MTIRVKVPVSFKCDFCKAHKDTSGELTYIRSRVWHDCTLLTPAVLILAEGWTKGILMCTRERLYCPQCAEKAGLKAPMLLTLELPEAKES